MWLVLAALTSILALAALLRLWQLDVPPLWWDEGNNAYFAHYSLPEILASSRLTHDTDPPAHRAMLGLWLWLLGDSAFSLRSLSAALGVSLVVLVYVWGRWLAGSMVGLTASLLTALSPLTVYYSREAKGYPVVAFFGLLSFYLWSRYLDDRRDVSPALWAAYLISGALALGTHYYAIFLFVAQLLWLIIDLPRSRGDSAQVRRRLLTWLGANSLIGALVLPWVLFTYDTALAGALGLGVNGAANSVPQYLRVVASEIAAGPNAPAWVAEVAVVLLGVSAIFGLYRSAYRSWAPLVALIVTSASLSFLVQRAIPFFSPRFLLYVAPAVYLLAATGLVRLKKFGIFPFGCLVAMWLVALPTLYPHPIWPEEDLRPISDVLREMAKPDDVVVVGYIWQEGILRLYAPGERSYRLGWFDPKNDPNRVGQELRAVVADHPRLWLVTYKAPLRHEMNPGGLWLEQNAARVFMSEYGNGRIVLYLNPFAESARIAAETTFEGGIHVKTSSIPDKVAVAEALGVTLTWSVDAAPQQSYSVFVHLDPAAGGQPVAQSDDPPAHGLRPFSQFLAGQEVVDRRVILVPRDLPPGRYRVTVGVYRQDNGSRLRRVDDASGADSLLLGYVEVVPAGS